jgi:PPK2 family polyphosphate:nucleotide phosphotransferase
MIKHVQDCMAKSGKKVKLKKINTADTNGYASLEQAHKQMASDIEKLSSLQEKLYSANQKYSVLIILQAMDAAGKDGVIKHVISGLNPQGCDVTSFKHPQGEETEHSYFWRYNKALPSFGKIGIFNRSYYEEVLICRVHPQLVVSEKIPGYDAVAKIDKGFWKDRFRQINQYERTLTENGTIILKFFLHISKEEQKDRLLKRIEDPEKHWKFSFADIHERAYWDEYMKYYTEAIEATSTTSAPWYIIPADHKWFARAKIASVLAQTLSKLKLEYPVLSKEENENLMKAKETLLK